MTEAVNSAWPYVGTIAAALIAFAGTWLVQRTARKQAATNVAQLIIDQIQEERASDRATFLHEKQSLENRMARAFERIELLEARERILLDYVERLRYHIGTGATPPPPPWPPELVK